ncbi:MAG TPA: peptide chain release factor N(5)-glutamine methyltransferase [Desulfobaccales bacterium]|jgi:release factor glutamine methyltransferase|nr:peptide chain release factor N(5)-glutamine methyltransferase [Desulfobaccales bacterium]
MADPPASWTILTTIRWTADYFRAKGVPEPRSSAEILLAHTLGVSRLDLYLRYDQPLNPEELARFKALMVRRREGEPVAYLTGHREFWSLDIRVTPAVLIPRPETETLVAAAQEAAESAGAGLKPAPALEDHPETQNLKPETSPLWGAEIGVGSGAVVIALAKELPQMAWVGLDRSGAALAVARDNARRHEVVHRVHFLQADLLNALKPNGALALLVANLPYVPRAEWERLPREIKAFEPPEALLGGEDGLDLIRPLIRQAQQYVKGGGWVLLEVGDRQAPQVADLFKKTEAYDRIETIKDFSGMERVVRARRRDATG